MSQPGHYKNNVYASGELPTGVPRKPEVTYRNPELDIAGQRREVHEFSTAYDHGVHGRRAVGSQISVSNSITDSPFRKSERMNIRSYDE